MQIGDKVRNKETGEIGTVAYSTFGFSIHVYRECNEKKVLCKTLGMPKKEVLEYWDIVK